MPKASAGIGHDATGLMEAAWDAGREVARKEMEMLRAFVEKCAAVQNDEGWQGDYWREARALLTAQQGAQGDRP